MEIMLSLMLVVLVVLGIFAYKIRAIREMNDKDSKNDVIRTNEVLEVATNSDTIVVPEPVVNASSKLDDPVKAPVLDTLVEIPVAKTKPSAKKTSVNKKPPASKRSKSNKT